MKRSGLLFGTIATGVALGTFGNAAGRAPIAPRADGIIGYSGQHGVNCNFCHSGGTKPTVALSGPKYVLHDSTRTFSFRVSGGQSVAAGLDVSVDTGTLVATETGTYIDSGELTHDTPRTVDSNGDAIFSFDFTAPSSSATVKMWAAGNSVDLSGSNNGDKAAQTFYAFRVVDNLTSFVAFGDSLAGSGGIAPRLVGVDGPSLGPWTISVEEGLGGATGLLWAGLGTADQFPVFGGHFYVDFAVPPLYALPFALDGTPGTPGDGSYDLIGIDVSGYAPLTLYLQATIVDAGAIKKISLTNALQMDITK